MKSIYDHLHEGEIDILHNLIINCMQRKNLINPNEEELNFDLLVEFENPN
tara:strand:- start:357 stop:506 length:150 start_codon:yes stop_codon:yes gene_type:complete